MSASQLAAADFTAGRENGRRRPRGYAPWRPQRKTRDLLELVLHVLGEYVEQLPLTVRQVFYRLVALGAVEKTERAYANLAEHLVRARRACLVPFDVIRDDGVVTYSERWHAGPEDFWDDTARRMRAYRRDARLASGSGSSSGARRPAWHRSSPRSPTATASRSTAPGGS